VTESSPSGFRSSASSGTYKPRPSIARYIESSISGVFTTATHVKLNLGVLSDHQVYASEGMLRGMFVVTGIPAPVGSPVDLEVLLPWGEVIEVGGVVEWIRPVPKVSLRHRPGMGVRFDVLPAHLLLLERAMLLREPMAIPADATR
jgi:hypothetical protein